ncbi:hypothetical protein SAMN05421747_13314 [Parapedobacter composti]|uniref:Uncharacterized protein n=1 Tax=Parapedobacter composti TaxID=623281 RepID=A0A1I1MP10_9SPHI|nr:hypothetical protein SAMN05421747_13314 [Parapedobacter composti]
MKYFLCLCLALFLCFSACKKNDIIDRQEVEVKPIKFIVINGTQYPEDSIRAELSKSLGVDTSAIYFDSEIAMYILKGYSDMKFNPKLYLQLQ